MGGCDRDGTLVHGNQEWARPADSHQRRFKAGSEGESAVWVFTNARTREAYTVNGVAHMFKRALKRANILTADVSVHTLRHTALSRMIASGIDDFTVMAISGHRSARMLERYTHPTNARKIDALESIPASLGRNWAEQISGPDADPAE